jgi:hypothetical protein
MDAEARQPDEADEAAFAAKVGAIKAAASSSPEVALGALRAVAAELRPAAHGKCKDALGSPGLARALNDAVHAVLEAHPDYKDVHATALFVLLMASEANRAFTFPLARTFELALAAARRWPEDEHVRRASLYVLASGPPVDLAASAWPADTEPPWACIAGALNGRHDDNVAQMAALRLVHRLPASAFKRLTDADAARLAVATLREPLLPQKLRVHAKILHQLRPTALAAAHAAIAAHPAAAAAAAAAAATADAAMAALLAEEEAERAARAADASKGKSKARRKGRGDADAGGAGGHAGGAAPEAIHPAALANDVAPDAAADEDGPAGAAMPSASAERRRRRAATKAARRTGGASAGSGSAAALPTRIASPMLPWRLCSRCRQPQLLPLLLSMRSPP